MASALAFALASAVAVTMANSYVTNRRPPDNRKFMSCNSRTVERDERWEILGDRDAGKNVVVWVENIISWKRL